MPKSNPDTVRVKQESSPQGPLSSWQGDEPQTQLVITIRAVSFPETSFGKVHVPEYRVSASCANPNGGHHASSSQQQAHNTVNLTTVQTLQSTKEDREGLARHASAGNAFVVLEWILDMREEPVFKTRHLLVLPESQQQDDIVFAKPLDWAHRLADHLESLNLAQDGHQDINNTRIRGITLQQQQQQQQQQCLLAIERRRSSSYCDSCYAARRQQQQRRVRKCAHRRCWSACSAASSSSRWTPPATSDPHAGNCGGQDAMGRRQCSQRLIALQRQYAEENYRTTRDTSGLLTAMNLAQRRLRSSGTSRQ